MRQDVTQPLAYGTGDSAVQWWRKLSPQLRQSHSEYQRSNISRVSQGSKKQNNELKVHLRTQAVSSEMVTECQ